MVPSVAGDLDVLQRHLAHLTHLGHRPNTINARRWCLLHTRRTVGDLLAATEQDLYQFVSRDGLGAEARNNAISHLHGFYGWALRHDHITDDPTVRLERPRRPRRYPRPMSEVDLARALLAASEPISSWLHLAAFAGLRCCEIAPLRGEDYRGGLLVIREQKGGDEGVVPVGPILRAAVARLPRHGVWFARWDGQPGPISAGQLQHHANRFLRDVGIESTMHTLRHRFITQVYETSGRDMRVTQDLARHKSILSTAGYAWVDPRRGADAVALLGLPA